MKLTRGAVEALIQAMIPIMKQEMPATAAYRMQKNARLLTQIHNESEAIRVRTVHELGTEDPETKVVTVAEDKREEFFIRMQQLTAEEVELALMQVPIALLGNTMISAAAIEGLVDIIITGETPEVPKLQLVSRPAPEDPPV